MRWHPPTAHVPRVIVWQLFTNGGRRKPRWYWRAKSRNGRLLAKSVEGFSSRDQALQAAKLFGRPALLEHYNSITCFHDGQILVLNWRH